MRLVSKDKEQVFIPAGSTHEPEERFALETYIALLKSFRFATRHRSRHAERFKVAKQAESSASLSYGDLMKAGRTFSGISPASPGGFARHFGRTDGLLGVG
ncbi:MAG: hypothetical protein R3B91_11100 [Planctomycetaceae bacterium]